MIIDQAKEYLAEDRFKIKLHGLVAGEIRRVRIATADDQFPLSNQWSIKELEARLTHYESALNDLLRIQILTAHWGEPSQQSALRLPAARLGQRILASSGNSGWIALQWYPLLLLLYSGGIAAVAAGNYENLRELMLTKVSDSFGQQPRVDLCSVVTKNMSVLADAFKLLPGHERHHAPRSEYLLKVLQPPVEEMLFLGTGYEDAFDRFELLYALGHAYQRKLAGERTWGPVGRFGWKHRVVSELVAEAERHGSSWAPLKTGIFGSNVEEFLTLVSEYKGVFSGIH
jgi:hypothetical protein